MSPFVLCLTFLILQTAQELSNPPGPGSGPEAAQKQQRTNDSQSPESAISPLVLQELESPPPKNSAPNHMGTHDQKQGKSPQSRPSEDDYDWMSIAEIVLASALIIVTFGLLCFARNQWRSIKEQNWIMRRQHELEKRRHTLSKLAFYTEYPPKIVVRRVKASNGWLNGFKRGITTVLDLEEATGDKPKIDVWVSNTGRTEATLFWQRADLIYYGPKDVAFRFGDRQEPEDMEVKGGKRQRLLFGGSENWKPVNSRQVNMPVTKVILALRIRYTDKLDRESVLSARFDYSPKNRRFDLKNPLADSDDYEYDD